MKVLHINTYDTGGAAIACIRLHQALLMNGIESHLLTLYKTRSDINNHLNFANFISPSKEPTLANLIKERLKKKLTRKGFNKKKEHEENVLLLQKEASIITDWFSLIDSPYRINILPNLGEYDIINLHWVADFLDWSSFFSTSSLRKVVWTLHDMNPFTGGYHYSAGYNGYKGGDSRPPFLLNTFDLDFARKQLLLKRKILSSTNIDIKIVTPSVWLKNCSSESTLFHKLEHLVIPNSVNINTFRILDKSFCREVLHIPKDKKVILFISDKIHNKRKGYSLLLEVLPQLNPDEYILCSIGNAKEPNSLKDQVMHFGKVSDERIMALAYNSADVFVLPSKEDNLPNVVLESLCCGTPVVGFKIGGMTDMITNWVNGLLCDVSSSSLLNAIKDVTKDLKRFDNEKISERAQTLYSPNVQAKAYEKLYNSFES